MISARIEAINKKNQKILWMRRTIVFGLLTERDEYLGPKPPSNNTVLKGKWWYLDKENT